MECWQKVSQMCLSEALGFAKLSPLQPIQSLEISGSLPMSSLDQNLAPHPCLPRPRNEIQLIHNQPGIFYT